MKPIDYKNFGLESIAVDLKNRLTIQWYDLTKRNDLLTVESDSIPHDEMLVSISDFKKAMAVSLGLTSGWEFAREHNRKNEESLRLAVNGCLDEYERCEVKKVSFFGSGDLEHIKIKGSLNCENESISISSTPKIDLFDSERDEEFNDYLSTACETLKKEAFNFVYLGKRGNSLFDSDESGLNNSKATLKAV
jgi:hypothetical protein